MPFPDRVSGSKNPWEAKELWPNSIIYILGSGLSLSILKNNNCLKNKHVIAVNQAYTVNENSVDILFFGDARCYWENYSLTGKNIDDFNGIKISLNIHCSAKGAKWGSIEGKKNIHIMNESKKRGLTKTRTELCWNNFSGAAAINLAVHLGAKKIILLGYDMGIAKRKIYWNNVIKNKDIARNIDSSIRYRNQNTWKLIKKNLDRLNIEIFNASKYCKFNIIPKINFEDIL